MRMLGRHAIVSSVIFGILFTLPGLLPGMSAATAQAQTPQATLNQYIADLQKNPNDYALREKIIRHVQTMRQKPAIPEDAERRMARGSAAVKGAKNEKDFQDAAVEFEKASLAAPWLPAIYCNLGITQDKAGKYKESIQSLKLYLLAAPDASDAKVVKNLIYEIEYRQEKAAKEPPRQVSTAPLQNTFEDLLRKIDGRRYTCPIEACSMVIDVRGKVFIMGNLCPQNHDVPNFRGYVEGFRDEIRGRETTVPIYNQPAHLRVRAVSKTYVISDDGGSITYRVRYNDGDMRQYIFLWQR